MQRMRSRPIRDTLNDHDLCCECLDKLKYRMCHRYLRPHLYTDGDGTICNTFFKKSIQRGRSSVDKALRDILGQHVFDGGNDQSL